MPKLTIVTVTFNDLDGLKHTRASILNANGAEIEHLIIDGGSKDGTVEYLAGLPDGVRWVSEKDRGPYDAMNKGAELARGEWVMFLNSGDTLAEQSILGNLLTAADGSDAGLAYGDHLYKGRFRKAKSLESLHELLADGDVKGWLRGHPCHQAVIARRRLLLEMPFDLGFRIAADFHWMEKVRGRGEKSLKVDGPVCVYQPGGLSSRSFLRCTIEWWKVVKLAGGSSARCKAFFLKSLRKHGRRKWRRSLLGKIRGLLGL
jgi:glycosyltransferase involved in cell wall biosynthesis